MEQSQSSSSGETLAERILQSPARVAVISFAVAILVGTLFLCLPFSSKSGEWTSPVDALFTSTSAVCVTGLIVKNTPVYWSLFGQLVILALIQAGGLGIMTVYAFLASLVRTRLSLGFERMVSDVVEAHPERNIWTEVKFICILTLTAELIGAVCLFFSWGDSLQGGLAWRIYTSVFHSISAFCNAGFSVFPNSLMDFRSNVPVNVTVCLLIVAGGIGFLVIRDLVDWAKWWVLERKGRRAQLSTHTKLVLTVTFVLLVSGFVFIFIVESTGSLKGAPLKDRLLAAMFQSVTPRTAGFNTMDVTFGTMAPSMALLLIVLMFIGGSPGSTAGGIKTSTLGVMISSIIATLRGHDRAEMFHHSVRQDTVHRVASVILLSLVALIGGTFLLLITEKGAEFLTVAFEATSAFGTVGLSMGITPKLTVLGRLIVSALMFVGRLGPVTIVLSAAVVEERISYRYPSTTIMVG